MDNHTPERTCVVCREKKDKKDLFRIAKISESNYSFDEKQKMQTRSIYVCKTHECIQRISKNKKYNLRIEDLLAMVNLLKKQSKDYLNILKAMKNSDHLAFGINMVMEDLDHIHFLIIAEDISEKNDKKLIAKAKELNISYVHYGNKFQLGEIFKKDEVNVIAVKNKKIARGLID
ncbi:DUF448 domain-containing protein [uncultured Cetobacterium sp.]|uniref:DUF448 domain-containing protein n=1 Tax=uncultured Cetobacterium sp. TaxID=527638 RepID=UPI0026190AA9|nr:DUF448 domain-containing protein [uncultured Cetobacterium sp.]